MAYRRQPPGRAAQTDASVGKLRVSRWRLTRHGISASVAARWCFRRSATYDVSRPAKKAPQRRDRRRGTSPRNFTPSARVLSPLLSPAASRLPAKRFGHYQTLGDSSQSPALVRRARVGPANALRQIVIKGFERQGCAASPLGLPAATNSPPRLPIRQSHPSLGRPASLPSVPPLPEKWDDLLRDGELGLSVDLGLPRSRGIFGSPPQAKRRVAHAATAVIHGATAVCTSGFELNWRCGDNCRKSATLSLWSPEYVKRFVASFSLAGAWVME